jgi:hypothetical protein
MTPEQKIKSAIIKRCVNDTEIELTRQLTADSVDEIYDELDELHSLGDYKYEMREGQIETGLPCEHSRHYESKSVATRVSDGSWVGWTYWYGGGKHGEPESIDWMGSAYGLDCTEEEKMVTVRTFKKKETAQ